MEEEEERCRLEKGRRNAVGGWNRWPAMGGDVVRKKRRILANPWPAWV